MPYELHNKKLQELQAFGLCVRFCEANEIPLPMFETRRYSKQKCHRARLRGIYNPRGRVIRVYPENCITASSSPYCYTWPGYRADNTVIGVLAHELGHHWHWSRPESELSGRRHWRVLAEAYKHEVRATGERLVTSYGASNCSEGIAEGFKLFVTNPTLLLALHPFHYAFFWRRGLRPVVTEHWSEILAGSKHQLARVHQLLVSAPPIDKRP